ncbi:hypothetical protein LTS18_014713, partial [Coniosporium uncinatum]
SPSTASQAKKRPKNDAVVDLTLSPQPRTSGNGRSRPQPQVVDLTEDGSDSEDDRAAVPSIKGLGTTLSVLPFGGDGTLGPRLSSQQESFSPAAVCFASFDGPGFLSARSILQAQKALGHSGRDVERGLVVAGQVERACSEVERTPLDRTENVDKGSAHCRLVEHQARFVTLDDDDDCTVEKEIPVSPLRSLRPIEISIAKATPSHGGAGPRVKVPLAELRKAYDRLPSLEQSLQDKDAELESLWQRLHVSQNLRFEEQTAAQGAQAKADRDNEEAQRQMQDLQNRLQDVTFRSREDKDAARQQNEALSKKLSEVGLHIIEDKDARQQQSYRCKAIQADLEYMENLLIRCKSDIDNKTTELAGKDDRIKVLEQQLAEETCMHEATVEACSDLHDERADLSLRLHEVKNRLAALSKHRGAKITVTARDVYELFERPLGEKIRESHDIARQLR